MQKERGNIRLHQMCVWEAARLQGTHLILADLGQMPVLPCVISGARLDPLSILDGKELPAQLICGVDTAELSSDQVEQAELISHLQNLFEVHEGYEVG